MVILKHGNGQIQKTCPNCNCVFAFTRNEEKYTYVPGPFSGQLIESYHWVNCPECKWEIEV